MVGPTIGTGGNAPRREDHLHVHVAAETQEPWPVSAQDTFLKRLRHEKCNDSAFHAGRTQFSLK